MTMADEQRTLLIAAEAARDKKAEGIELLDLRGMNTVTGYFLICHGNSQRQVKAIVDEIDRRLREHKRRPSHSEGVQAAEWVLIDYIDFVVHVFTRDRRTFYGLEKLWAEAPRLKLPPTEATASPSAPGAPSRPGGA